MRSGSGLWAMSPGLLLLLMSSRLTECIVGDPCDGRTGELTSGTNHHTSPERRKGVNELAISRVVTSPLATSPLAHLAR